MFLLSRFAEPLSHATDTTVACASLRRTRPSFESFLALRAFMCVCRCFWVFFFSRPRRSLSLFRARGVVARCRSRVTFFPSCERADSAGVSALLILSAPTLLPLHIGRSGVKVPQPATSCNAERISCSPFGGDPLSLLPVSRAARHRSLRVRAVFYRPLPCIPACYSP